jgi:hypothetical protein
MERSKRDLQCRQGTITKQAPQYAKVMKDYKQASEKIKEIQKSFSTSGTTDHLALQAAVSAAQLCEHQLWSSGEAGRSLMNTGAPNLMKKIAGRALNASTPRGLSGLIAKGELACMVPARSCTRALP